MFIFGWGTGEGEVGDEVVDNSVDQESTQIYLSLPFGAVYVSVCETS